MLKAIGFTPALHHDRIGDGWATWSHGYTGDQSLLANLPKSAPMGDSTVTLPLRTTMHASAARSATVNDSLAAKRCAAKPT